MKAQKTTTVMNPVSKTIYGTIQIGLVNNIYDKLINDEDIPPTVYKTSWLLDTAASDNYADNKTIMQNKKEIQPGTGINAGCADKVILSQTGEG